MDHPVTGEPRATHQVQFERLRDELFEGRYLPGDLLLETTIAKAYGVSRTPVREAMLRLEESGFLTRVQRGFQVRVRSAEEVIELYDARILLEGHVAALAALHHNEFDRVVLEGLLEHSRTAEKREHVEELDARFHRSLRAASHSSVFSELLARLDGQVRLHGYRRLGDAPNLRRSHDEHARIAAAVLARDAAGAELAARAHQERVRDVRVQELAFAPLPPLG